MGQFDKIFACCSALLLFVAPVWSQEAARPAGATAGSATVQKGVPLSAEKLKACEGYFRSPQNKDMVIQFVTEKHMLVAKLLWINRAFPLYAVSDSSFVTVDSPEGRPIPVAFLRDNQGIFSKAKVNNSDIWDRANGYTPLVRKEIAHTPAELKVFEGTYQLGTRETYLQIAEKDNKLILRQYWDGVETVFVPDSAAHFFCSDQPLFTLRFIRDKNGEVQSMLAFGRDMWNKVGKLDLSAEQLKKFEGKYQLKDDKDDLIRIIARDGRLVIKQLWDGKEVVVDLVGGKFFSGGGSYSVNFDLDKEGNVGGVVIMGTDVFEKVKE